MKVLESTKGFKSFYQDKGVVLEYDKKRLKTARQRILRELERTLPLKFIKQGSNILEIGCGTGFVTNYLLKKGTVTAVDSSEEMLKKCKATIKAASVNAPIKFVKSSLFEFYSTKKFQYVVSIRVMLHLKKSDLTKASATISESMKKEGLFMFDVESKSFFKKFFMAVRWTYTKKEVINPQYSKNDLKTAISKKFEIIKIIPYDHAVLILPFYLIAEVSHSEKLENIISKMEKTLSWLPILNTRWFVVCKKLQ